MVGDPTISYETTECIICFEQNEIVYLVCAHSMCIFCYETMLNQDTFKCPVCRTTVESFVPVPVPVPEPAPEQQDTIVERYINSECCYRNSNKLVYTAVTIGISILFFVI